MIRAESFEGLSGRKLGNLLIVYRDNICEANYVREAKAIEKEKERESVVATRFNGMIQRLKLKFQPRRCRLVLLSHRFSSFYLATLISRR